MDQIIAEILFTFLRTCEQSTEKAQIIGAVESVIQRLGIDHFAMTLFPLAHERLDAYFISERWPSPWLKRYLKYNYFHSDPVVRLLRSSGQPIVWSKSIAIEALDGKPKRIMNEAGDFGLVDGVTIPLHSQVGLNGLFSVGGKREPMEPLEVGVLQIVAEHAHRRLIELNRSPLLQLDNLHITRRESECLTLCAMGKTDTQIGFITGRSPRTAQAHIRNLQKKIGASNRAQLIAEAFRRGLLR